MEEGVNVDELAVMVGGCLVEWGILTPHTDTGMQWC